VSTPDADELARDLHAVAIRLLRNARRDDLASGLTAARLSALSVVVFGGRASLGELARAEQVSLPTMTRIAAALVQRGYVRRAVDPDDRRYVYLEPTARGAKLLDDGRRRRVARVRALLAGLSISELRACERALSALRRRLT